MPRRARATPRAIAGLDQRVTALDHAPHAMPRKQACSDRSCLPHPVHVMLPDWPAAPQHHRRARRVCAALRHGAVPPDQRQAGEPLSGGLAARMGAGRRLAGLAAGLKTGQGAAPRRLLALGCPRAALSALLPPHEGATRLARHLPVAPSCLVGCVHCDGAGGWRGPVPPTRPDVK